ncbi:MAG: vitamin K epoxide reductase family protein [Armatimonadota bacterium]|nr:vitamin K epoxide reductase family protein [Armatimonadota bacterium]MDR7422290.1 vitamin K epoxide reductase family protein [Armatimonadota bacterium]MDR7453758.1 vitamin K epoxide reductase family protein [Armatimonadota bacterium]MDR7456287.1 vitamin K epoxide reductase family protein [Armatimonadota bacterium]MDR7496284.1 vitamin K epoxide reductase family protein [Armatimonadota bacterium]
MSAALAGSGVAVSAYLTVTGLRGAPPVCLAGDCAAVAASRFARFLGLPTAFWGLGLFLVVAVLAVAMARGGVRRVDGPLVFLGLAVFGAAFSAYLLWVQAAVLRAFCAWCLASDLLWAALVVAAAAGLRGR